MTCHLISPLFLNSLCAVFIPFCPSFPTSFPLLPYYQYCFIPTLHSFISSPPYVLLSSIFFPFSFRFCPPSISTSAGLQQWQQIVFNEQWDAEQRSQWDRTTQPVIQFPSLIHYSHPDFYLWDEDFYFEVIFNFHVPKQHMAAFILTKDICVSKTVRKCSVHWTGSRHWG